MSDSLQLLAAECASALRQYLAEPQEAGLLHAYELGRRALTLQVGVAELGVVHRNVLATLPDAATPEECARVAQRAAEFLGETMAPLEMAAGGYREANVLVQRVNEALEELKQAGRRKDEFLAMLAHELRNPLAPLRNAIQLMRLAHHDAVEVGQASALMERQVQHLIRLIDDLMDISRIERGKIELRKERIELGPVVERAVEISRPHIEAARHELTVVLPPEPLVMDADPARLTQVVANLLNNASKYTEPGGSIELTLVRNGTEAILRVRDTGLGIPADMLPHIFDLFVQVPSTLQRAQGGLGIGLALVKSLVELHGGRVEVHSAGPGHGSEFRLHLPLVAEERLSQDRPSPGP
jgi:signal transduction histidine kinase